MTRQNLTKNEERAAWDELIKDACKLEKFAGSHDFHIDHEIVDQILSQWKSKDGTWLVLFNLEFVISLVYTYNVPSEHITFYSDHPNKSLMAKKLNINIIDKTHNNYDDEIKRLTNMKILFDNSVSNVPYNTREDSYKGEVDVAGGKMGTVGNKTIGRKLNKLQKTLTKDGGYIAHMGLKTGMLDDTLNDEPWDPTMLSLMVDKQWWDYNTFWVFGKKETNQNNYQIYGSDINSRICGKIFSKNDTFPQVFQQDSWKQLKDKDMITDKKNNHPRCIVRSYKKKDMQILRAYPTDKGINKVVYGPKFTHYGAESAITWLVTDEPMLCDCAVIYSHTTLAEAEKQKLFTEKHPILKFFHKTMKVKGLDQYWGYTKKFDLNQIKTGLEYPIEYNLTQEEQDYINEKFARK
jgi:hypothetical protein